MTLPEASAQSLADHLCDAALWDDGHAVWLGDERQQTDGGSEVVHRSIDGDLYGGTAGIALALARLYRHTGTARYLETARGAVRHSARWLDRQQPTADLYAGCLGVLLAMAEVAAAASDEPMMADVRSRADVARLKRPPGFDLVSGSAGAVIGWRALARLTGQASLADEAELAISRLRAASRASAAGAWWSDSPTDQPLCGLAHGASGAAWALSEVAVADDDETLIGMARSATRYERGMYSAAAGGWPDLREFDHGRLARGDVPTRPAMWCHGSIGIGLVRLRMFELFGDPADAAESSAAISTLDALFAVLDHSERLDFSLCHGLAGAVELLVMAGEVFGDQSMRDRAHSVAATMCDLAEGSGSWPCGVPGGTDNPSLMLGRAGVALALLRSVVPGIERVGLLYTEPISTTRIIVKVEGALDQAAVTEYSATFGSTVPGSRVVRVSRTGRFLLELTGRSDAALAVSRLAGLDGVAYAEIDSVDHATDR